jgi:hypothetical protein
VEQLRGRRSARQLEARAEARTDPKCGVVEEEKDALTGSWIDP